MMRYMEKLFVAYLMIYNFTQRGARLLLLPFLIEFEDCVFIIRRYGPIVSCGELHVKL